MTAGRVIGLQATVAVRLRLDGRPDIEIEFVVDTGFEGALSLPPAAVRALRLPFLQEIIANLADDSEVRPDVHGATIMWRDQEMEVQLISTGTRPLLGTALLAGSELVAQFVDGGLVTIDDL